MKKIDEMIYLGAVEVEISAKTSHCTHLERVSDISTDEDELDKLFNEKQDEARLKEQRTGQQLVQRMIRMQDVRDLVAEDLGALFEEISEIFVLTGMNCFDVDVTEEDKQNFADRLNALESDLQSLTGGDWPTPVLYDTTGLWTIQYTGSVDASSPEKRRANLRKLTLSSCLNEGACVNIQLSIDDRVKKTFKMITFLRTIISNMTRCFKNRIAPCKIDPALCRAIEDILEKTNDDFNDFAQSRCFGEYVQFQSRFRGWPNILHNRQFFPSSRNWDSILSRMKKSYPQDIEANDITDDDETTIAETTHELCALPAIVDVIPSVQQTEEIENPKRELVEETQRSASLTQAENEQQQEINKLKVELAQESQLVSSLTQAANETKDEMETLTLALERQSLLVSSLTQAENESEQEIKKVKVELAQESQLVSSLTQAAKETQEEIKNLRLELHNEMKKAAESKYVAATATSNYEAMKTQLESIALALQKAEENCARLEKKISVVEGCNRKLQSSRDKLSKTSASNLQLAHEELEKKSSEMRMLVQQHHTMLEKQTADHSSEMHMLEQQLQSTLEKQSEDYSSICMLQAQNKMLSQHVESMKEKLCENFRLPVGRLHEIICETPVTEDLQQIQRQLGELKANVDAKIAEHQFKQIDEYKSKLAQASIKLEIAQDTECDLREQLTKTKQEVESLRILTVQQVEEAEKAKREEHDECRICLDAKPTHMFYPCMHICMCQNCAADYRQQNRNDCPMCRRKGTIRKVHTC